MPTCKCGKQVEDWRGARGHVQFTGGDGHGDHGEVPDDWRDLFDEDGPDEQKADEDGQQDADDDDGDEADPSPSSTTESDSGQSEGSQGKGRIRRVLTTPLDELLGGD